MSNIANRRRRQPARAWPPWAGVGARPGEHWPAVPAACKGNALLTDEGCATNGFDNFEKIWFWRTPTAKCEQEGNCVPYSQWAKDYIGILGK